VAAPGVRLVAERQGRTLLAWTGFEAGHFVVRATDVVDGHLGAPQTLSPTSEDAVLGDAATRADGAAVVAWRSGVQGADPVPGATEAVLASHRGPGEQSFGAPEQVTAPGEDVPTAPFAALDPVSGRSLVAYGLLGPALKASARP
jgi:hypothetical protein